MNGFVETWIKSSKKPVSKNTGPELYSEHCKTSETVIFAKIFKDWKLLIILTESSILDVLQHSEYASDISIS